MKVEMGKHLQKTWPVFRGCHFKVCMYSIFFFIIRVQLLMRRFNSRLCERSQTVRQRVVLRRCVFAPLWLFSIYKLDSSGRLRLPSANYFPPIKAHKKNPNRIVFELLTWFWFSTSFHDLELIELAVRPREEYIFRFISVLIDGPLL